MAVSEGYRYGFNGMERDDEWNGTGNAYDFGARIYDSRIGLWLSLDPQMMKFPDLSPYNFVLSRPIELLDPDGETPITGAVLGALSEYMAQVGVNYFVENQEFSDALINVNGWDIGVAATFGALTGGIGSVQRMMTNKFSRRIFKRAVKFAIEGVVESLENATKDFVKGQEIDVVAAITGGFLEAGIGEFMPSPKFFKRQANKGKREVRRAEDKMNRSSWNTRDQSYRDKWTKRKESAEKSVRINTRVANSIETVQNAFAEGGANALMDESLYVKPIGLDEVIITPKKETVGPTQ